MAIRIKRDECTGCGLCVSTCPEVFEMDNEDKAKVIDPDSTLECVQESVETCPVEAIEIT